MQRVGEFQIDRVVESEVPFIEPEVFLPDIDMALLEANADWIRPRYIDAASGKLNFAFQSYVVRNGRHTILVDACVGNDKPRPARPTWHMQNWPYLETLAGVGVQPEEIDFVMCTHLHIDHVGWNTRLLDGRWVPTFPNAKYIFARTEYEFWEQRDRSGEQGPVPNVFADSVLPVMEAGQCELVDMDYQFDNGLWFEPAPGHTNGNVVINLKSTDHSGDHNAVLSGDVLHHPVQLVCPEWSSRACEDPVQSGVTRRALIERLVDSPTLVAPAHFASPSMGHIISRGDSFEYRLAAEG
jgi:glyoxylase-like metal-dependent hydrolase (beta-lactamase superfamily II)